MTIWPLVFFLIISIWPLWYPIITSSNNAKPKRAERIKNILDTQQPTIIFAILFIGFSSHNYHLILHKVCVQFLNITAIVISYVFKKNEPGNRIAHIICRNVFFLMRRNLHSLDVHRVNSALDRAVTHKLH